MSVVQDRFKIDLPIVNTVFRFLIPLVFSGAFALSACASSPVRRCGSTPGGGARIAAQELLSTGASDLFTALRLSRPRFLRTRAPRKDAPVLYVDGVRVGELAYLRGMRTRSVASVRLLRGPDATTRYGTDHVGGALLVTTLDGSADAGQGCSAQERARGRTLRRR